MESKVETKVVQDTKPSSLKTDPPGSMVSKGETSLLEDNSLPNVLQPFVDFLENFPDLVVKIVQVYKKPLIYLGLIVSSIMAVYVSLTLLMAIDRIPLFAPFFELVGIGYTVWFVKRYVVNDSDRQKLSSELDALKTKVFGKKSTDS